MNGIHHKCSENGLLFLLLQLLCNMETESSLLMTRSRFVVIQSHMASLGTGSSNTCRVLFFHREIIEIFLVVLARVPKSCRT